MARREIVEMDLRFVQTAEQLHELLSDALGFPQWYGMNWDAFWDAITGLVEMPKKLRLVGWRGLTERLPRDAEIMRTCLDELIVEMPHLASEIEYV